MVEYNDTFQILFLSSEIDMDSVGTAAMKIIEWNEENEVDGCPDQPIKMYINSCGGDAYGALGLIDIMLSSKTPIHTYCMGSAESAGLDIFLAGSVRFCGEHATFMYHEPSATCEDGYTIKISDVIETRRLAHTYAGYIKTRTKITDDQLREYCTSRNDWWIDANEALNLGITHEIIKGDSQ